MKTAHPNPFTDNPPQEVPLPRAPLVRVVAQLRFPKVLAIGSGLSVAPFQEKIRSTYPALQEEKIHALQVTLGMQPETRVETVWRFSDAKAEWRVSLGSDFLAIESRAYTSRTDFIGRLTQVVDALAETIDPKTALRLGVRYISRVVSPEYETLPQLLKPSVLGVAGVDSFFAAHSVLMNEAVMKAKEGESRLRWGFLPKNTIHEPDLIDPVDQASWVCDIDSSTDEKQDFSAKVLAPSALALAERCYAVFRAMVTDDFLKVYGGEL